LSGVGFVGKIPLHLINHDLEFDTEEEAEKFVENVTGRITDAVNDLRSKQDSYSKRVELQF
jgi:hypothetical protein